MVSLFDEELFEAGISLLISLVGLGYGLTVYIFQALGLSALRKGREFHPYGRQRRDGWKAWVPFFNAWLMGDIADDINRFRGKRSNWRFWLLFSQLLPACFAVMVFSAFIIWCVYVMVDIPDGWEALGLFLVGVIALYVLVVLIEMLTVVLSSVFQGLSLYLIYKDYDPKTHVLYLLLSLILGGGIFLFVIRNRPSSTLYWAGRPVGPYYPPYPPPLPGPPGRYR